MVEQIAQQISAAHTKEEVFNILGIGLIGTLNASGAGILLVDYEKNQIYGAAAWPKEFAEAFRKVRISMDDRNSVAVSIAKTNSLVVVDNAEDDSRGIKWLVANFRVKSFISAPIVSDTKIIGIVAVGETRRFRHVTDEEVEKAKYLTLKAGETIQRLDDKN